jgi:signal transduction histidine kinase
MDVTPAPARRWRIAAPVVDGVLAVMVATALLVAVALDLEPGSRPADTGAYLLLAAIALPVLARRHRPLTALLASAIALTVYYAFDYPPVGAAVPLSVVLYTAAARGYRWWCVAVVVTQLAGALVARLLFQPEPLLFVLYDSSREAALLVAVLLLGEAVRSHRAWTAEVRTREARADLDREKEAQRRVIAERLRIAREMHDVLAHTVATVSVHAGVAADVLDDSPDDARAALTTIRTASREAMTELKATIGLLRDGDDRTMLDPPAPGMGQLPALIDQASDAGVAVTWTTDGHERPLPAGVETALYRVIQEAMTNVIRHAAAATAHITLRYQHDGVAVTIVDDGRGATPDAENTDGFGLVGMRERVSALGGDLDAGPATDGGYRVIAHLPASTV